MNISHLREGGKWSVICLSNDTIMSEQDIFMYWCSETTILSIMYDQMANITKWIMHENEIDRFKDCNFSQVH